MLTIIGMGLLVSGSMALMGKKHALRVLGVSIALGLCYRIIN
jgi:hypothetical protein